MNDVICKIRYSIFKHVGTGYHATDYDIENVEEDFEGTHKELTAYLWEIRKHGAEFIHIEFIDKFEQIAI